MPIAKPNAKKLELDLNNSCYLHPKESPKFMRCLALLIANGLASVVFFQSFSRAQGDIVMTMDNAKVFAGQTASVGVYATSTSGDIMTGFNLPTDFNLDGNAKLPFGFSYGSSVLTNVIFSNTGFDRPGSIVFANVDAIPTGSGANLILGLTPIKLFDIRVIVAGNVPVGTVLPIDIEIPATPLRSLFNVSGHANGNLAAGKPVVLSSAPGVIASGSITITAVPEPSVLALIAALSSGFVFKKNRFLARTRTMDSWFEPKCCDTLLGCRDLEGTMGLACRIQDPFLEYLSPNPDYHE